MLDLNVLCFAKELPYFGIDTNSHHVVPVGRFPFDTKGVLEGVAGNLPATGSRCSTGHFLQRSLKRDVHSEQNDGARRLRRLTLPCRMHRGSVRRNAATGQSCSVIFCSSFSPCCSERRATSVLRCLLVFKIQKIERAVSVVKRSSAYVPASEIPAETTPGDQTDTYASPGRRARIPPPTPLFAGRPT
jgi:hypothetical protein